MPVDGRSLARKNYQLWSKFPFHPSLHFKKIGGGKWSIRLGINYRAIGTFHDGIFVWDWIGNHAEYDQLP